MRDWLGTLIAPGCTIVYPGRTSGGIWMSEAIVEEVTELTGPFVRSDGTVAEKMRAIRVYRTRTNQFKGRVNESKLLTNLKSIVVIKPAPEEDASD